MDAFCGVGSGLGDDGLTGGDVRGFMKRRLQQYVRPSSVCTWCDLGVLDLDLGCDDVVRCLLVPL